MKKQAAALLLAAGMMAMTACGAERAEGTASHASSEQTVSAPEPEAETEAESLISEKEEPEATPTPEETFTMNQSSDKHIQYVNNYVGMNAASVGYTSLGGDRRVEIGAGSMLVTYVTADGSYVGVDDEEGLKDYVVTGQNIEPNTEVHIEFQKDSDGEEYDNLTDFMTYDHIDLAVKKTGESGEGPALVEIKGSPDKYTCYIRNYVGKNLGSIGYESLGGDFRDAYGDGNIKIDLVSDDGSYIDPSDRDQLKRYVVTAQSIEPNTEMKYTFQTDSEGNEYSFTDSQTYDAITLHVKALSGETAQADAVPAQAAPAETTDTAANTGDADAAGNDSAYEAIYNDYSQRMSDKVQTLIDEYNAEASGADLSKKAEISNAKVEVLADLCNEGVEEMASQMLSDGSDYSTYSTWSSKLYEDYMTDAQKIYDAYLVSAM